MFKNKISIIIPLYNKEKTIYNTINSVLNQTYNNFEIIIIDDGSTDRSKEIISNIKDSRIIYYFKKNEGVSSARNYGVKKSTSDWIIFLDADDIMLNNNIEILASLIFKYKTEVSAGNFYSNFIGLKTILNSNSNYEGIIKKNFKDYFKNKFSIRTGCTLIKKQVLLAYPFDENLKRFEDAESIFNILRNYSVAVSPLPIFYYLIGKDSLSSANCNFRNDFISKLPFRNKSFWEKLNLSNLVINGIRIYPKYRIKIISLYYPYLLYIIIAYINYFYNRIINKLTKKCSM